MGLIDSAISQVKRLTGGMRGGIPDTPAPAAPASAPAAPAAPATAATEPTYTRYNPRITTTPPTPPQAPNLTTSPGAAAAEPAAAAESAAARTGVRSLAGRAVSSLGQGVNTALNGDIGAGVGRVGSAVGDVASKAAGSPLLRSLGAAGLAYGAGKGALDAYNTDTSEFARRMGVETPDSFLGDLGVRTVGTLADVGNAVTGGLADKFGNLIAGNGFRSSDYAGGAPAAAPTAPAVDTSAAYPDTAAVRDSAAAMSAPANPIESKVVDLGGPSVQAQRTAPNIVPTDLRSSTVDALAGRPDTFGRAGYNVDAGNQNLRASLRGMQPGQAYQVSAAGASDPGNRIYATKDANGRLSLTGYGDGNADKAYTDSQQYKDAIARNEADKAQLAKYEEQHKEQDLIDRVNNSSIGSLRANAGALKQYYADRAEQKKLDAQLAMNRGLRQFEALKFGLERQDKLRDYNLNVEKFGEEQTKNDLAARESAQKSLLERLQSENRGPDGKVDDQAVARQFTAVNQFLSQRQQQLQQHLALNPDDAQAKSELANIQHRHAEGLDPDALKKIIAGAQAAQTAEQYSSGALNPVGGRAVMDSRPITSLRKTSNGIFGFGGEYTSNRGDRIPARAIEGDGSFVLGLRNRRFDDLIQRGDK